eukprot:jgi/Botrbrau1/10113/Bobra.20_2s0020.1
MDKLVRGVYNLPESNPWLDKGLKIKIPEDTLPLWEDRPLAPEGEEGCPQCGGPFLVRESATKKNPGRPFRSCWYCDEFKWEDRGQMTLDDPGLASIFRRGSTGGDLSSPGSGTQGPAPLGDRRPTAAGPSSGLVPQVLAPIFRLAAPSPRWRGFGPSSGPGSALGTGPGPIPMLTPETGPGPVPRPAGDTCPRCPLCTAVLETAVQQLCPECRTVLL